MNWASSNAAALNLLFSAVVMAATVVYALLTASLVRETIRMRTAQTDPDVAAYLEHDEHSIGVIHLVIRNIGNGPAYDLQFDLKDVQLKDWAAESIQRLSIWTTGMPYLAPGSAIRTVAGAAFQEGAREFRMTIHISFSSGDQKRRTNTFVLNYDTHYGVTQLGEPPIKTIAKELKAIRELLAKRLNNESIE